MPWKRIDERTVEITPETLSCGCVFDMLKAGDENNGFTYCALCKSNREENGTRWQAAMQRHRNELADMWGIYYTQD